MSAPDNSPTWEQPPMCGCAHETVIIVQTSRLAISLAAFAAVIALAAACLGWLTPETEVRYVPSSSYTWAPEPKPVEPTPTKERKAHAEFLAKGAADIKEWRVAQQLQKASNANVAQLYLCDAKSSTEAGRYVAASMIDRRGDQDWGVANGEPLGSPRAIAFQWCTPVPKWAQPTVPGINPDTER